jgi:hypothetical protein
MSWAAVSLRGQEDPKSLLLPFDFPGRRGQPYRPLRFDPDLVAKVELRSTHYKNGGKDFATLLRELGTRDTNNRFGLKLHHPDGAPFPEQNDPDVLESVCAIVAPRVDRLEISLPVWDSGRVGAARFARGVMCPVLEGFSHVPEEPEEEPEETSILESAFRSLFRTHSEERAPPNPSNNSLRELYMIGGGCLPSFVNSSFAAFFSAVRVPSVSLVTVWFEDPAGFLDGLGNSDSLAELLVAYGGFRMARDNELFLTFLDMLLTRLATGQGFAKLRTLSITVWNWKTEEENRRRVLDLLARDGSRRVDLVIRIREQDQTAWLRATRLRDLWGDVQIIPMRGTRMTTTRQLAEEEDTRDQRETEPAQSLVRGVAHADPRTREYEEYKAILLAMSLGDDRSFPREERNRFM